MCVIRFKSVNMNCDKTVINILSAAINSFKQLFKRMCRTKDSSAAGQINSIRSFTQRMHPLLRTSGSIVHDSFNLRKCKSNLTI
jgi:hypothetical protein